LEALSNSNRFGSTSVVRTLTPVRLPAGRLRLATRPSSTGFGTPVKTIGIAELAAFAAAAEAVPPDATMAATRKLANSAASAGKRP
jgi:hypothetical protein